MKNANVLTVEITPEIMNAAQITYSVTGKSWDDYAQPWTKDAIIGATYAHHSYERSSKERAAAKNDEDFDIADMECVYMQALTTYGSLAQTPEGRAWIEVQIKSHQSQSDTHARRAIQKSQLLSAYSDK